MKNHSAVTYDVVNYQSYSDFSRYPAENGADPTD
jgi:hypothetical protein